MKTFFLCICIFIGVNSHGQVKDTSNFDLPAMTIVTNQKKLTLWGTFYHVHSFYSSGKIPLLLNDEKPSGLYADTCDFCNASLEGTAMIIDSLGRKFVLNYASTSEKSVVDCRKCEKFKKSKLNVERLGKIRWSYSSGYGNGVMNYKLIPFRTIAVDKNQLPYGSILFIPSIRGLEFTDCNGKQQKHDGYFIAGDTGDAIKENHIDFFTGTQTKNPFPSVIFSDKNKPFTAYICDDNEISRKVK